MSAAAAARLERALSERLYLIERRDASETSPSGLVALRHEFAVLGSTGNVYEVAICRTPSCTCVDYRDRAQICKHLLFVYVKVLNVDRESHIPLQRALVRSELAEVLPDRDGAEELMASPAVRHAFRRATGRGQEEEEKETEEAATAAAAGGDAGSGAQRGPCRTRARRAARRRGRALRGLLRRHRGGGHGGDTRGGGPGGARH